MTIHSLGSFNVQKIQIDGMVPNLIGSGDVERPTWRVFLGTHFTGTRQAFNILFAKFESKSHNGLLDKFYNGQIRSCHLVHSGRTDRHVACFCSYFWSHRPLKTFARKESFHRSCSDLHALYSACITPEGESQTWNELWCIWHCYIALAILYRSVLYWVIM